MEKIFLLYDSKPNGTYNEWAIITKITIIINEDIGCLILSNKTVKCVTSKQK